jgi:hypothetical protein
MAMLFVSFGSKSFTHGGKFVHDIHGNSSGQTFDSKITQTPQFVYFDGLLSCPLKGSLSKVLSTPWL